MVFRRQEIRFGERGPAPFLRSVDAGVVQQMFGDDLALFKSLLARMLRDFSDLSLPITVAPHDRGAAGFWRIEPISSRCSAA